jgi:hypothetical protein
VRRPVGRRAMLLGYQCSANPGSAQLAVPTKILLVGFGLLSGPDGINATNCPRYDGFEPSLAFRSAV